MKFDPFATAEITPVVQFWRGALFYSSPGSVVNLDVAAAFRYSATPASNHFHPRRLPATKTRKEIPPNGIDGSPQWRNCPARRFSATLSLPKGRNNLKAKSIDGLTSSRVLIRREPYLFSTYGTSNMRSTQFKFRLLQYR